MATLADALALTARGFRVFPLRPNDWRPAIKGWQDAATTDEARVRKWWGNGHAYNVGVATGQGLLVVDIDNKKGKNGSASFADLDLPLESLDTFTVLTPSGGRHVYFNGPDVGNSAGQLGPGLDIRSAGGYVVGPGSTLTDGAKDGQPGGTYEALDIAQSHRGICVQPTPDRLAACLSVRQSAQANRGGGDATGDGRLPHGPATAYLEAQAPIARQGVGGDHTTFVVAAQLKDLGVDEFEALDLLLEHWNERCEPPWDPQDLKTKVANAYRYGENPPGSKSPEAMFDGVDVPPVLRPPSKFVRHGVQFNRDAQWLYYEVLPMSGVCVIVGETQSGKTFLELELARCGATGKKFFKTQPDEKFATIFAFAGTEGSGLARRFAALQEKDPLPISATMIGDLRRPGALKELLEDLQAEAAYLLATFGLRVGLVVVETLAASGLLPHENDAGEASQAMHNLANIANAMNVLVMTSHHPAKGTQEARGSGAVPAAADYVLAIKRQGRDKVRQVELVKARDAEQRSLGSFSLVPVDLGKDSRGRPITSMTVSMGEAEAPIVRASKHAPLVIECIEWATIESGLSINGQMSAPKKAIWLVFKERCKSPVDDSNKHKVYTAAMDFLESQGAIAAVEYGKELYVHKREVLI